MKIQKIFVAAFAVCAMSVVSHAREGASVASNADATQAESQQAETFGDLMKRVLRAGDATARQNREARARPQDQASQAQDAKEDAVAVASVAEADSTQDSRPFHGVISRYAGEYGVPVSLAHAIVQVESNYRKSARGRAGEIGLMQIKPRTARGMGFRGSAEALYDPENNIKYGMLYLSKAYELSGGDTCGTILRYNAGHAATRMNSVSSAYCRKVQSVLGGN